MNKLMTDMVKAKTLQTRQRINTDVRIEETSLSPQHQGSSYRHYWSA
jgi:hypothetical protein